MAWPNDRRLFISSKIQFSESKSQLFILPVVQKEGCLSVQRYNFLKANHNWISSLRHSSSVVYQFKDTIFWKQITTIRPKFRRWSMLFISSKIQFSESKSQLTSFFDLKRDSCLSVQRYNFLKANHNCKRIETFCRQLFISSKIQFSESKSQLDAIKVGSSSSCLSVQRYNFLKANHNLAGFGVESSTVVYQFKDTIFWKQITTDPVMEAAQPVLFISSKIQFSESKSQLNKSLRAIPESCLSVQRYNFLKANHNYSGLPCVYYWVVYQFKDTIFWKQITTNVQPCRYKSALFISSKIQFSESKSQHTIIELVVNWGCLSVQRYNFLKANHNVASFITFRGSLFISSKIQFSESKSQLNRVARSLHFGCLSVQRYNILKANHNMYAARGPAR